MGFKFFVCLIILVFIVAAPNAVLAQIEKSLSVTGQYDDNVFGNFQKLSDYVTQLYLNLSRDYDKDYSVWSLSYVGNLNLFNKYAFRNYHTHTLGLQYTAQLNPEGEEEEAETEADSTERDGSDFSVRTKDSVTHVSPDSLKNYFYTGASLAGRFNRDSVNTHDNAYATAFARLRWSLSESFVGRITYNVGYRSYFNLKELNNLENAVLLNMAKQLSGTRLFSEVGFGYKKYFSTTTDTTELIKLGFTPGGPGSGKGKGKGSGGSANGGSGQPIRGVVTTQLETPGTSQLTFGVGFAHRAGEETEFGLKYLLRTSPSLDARYVNGQLRFGPEDEIYDDPYSYRSHEFSGFFRHTFPWLLKMGIEIGYAPKIYGRPAYSLPDATGQSVVRASTREDKRFELTLGLEQEFKWTSGLAKSFSLQLTYSYLNNSSNDEFYHFTNNIVSIGLAADF